MMQLVIDKFEMTLKGTRALYNDMLSENVINCGEFVLRALSRTNAVHTFRIELSEDFYTPSIHSSLKFGTLSIRPPFIDYEEEDIYYFLKIDNEQLYASVQGVVAIKNALMFAEILSLTPTAITSLELAYDCMYDCARILEEEVKDVHQYPIIYNKTFKNEMKYIPYITAEQRGNRMNYTKMNYRISNKDRDFQLYAYCKSDEISVSKKYYIAKYHGFTGDFYRCEVRCHREQVEWFMKKNKVDMEAFLTKYILESEGLSALYDQLTKRIIRFRVSRKDCRGIYEILEKMHY